MKELVLQNFDQKVPKMIQKTEVFYEKVLFRIPVWNIRFIISPEVDVCFLLVSNFI